MSKLDNVNSASGGVTAMFTKNSRTSRSTWSLSVWTPPSPPPEDRPTPQQDVALMTPDQVVSAIRRTAVDHNIRLMHRFGREQLFANILEAARSGKQGERLRAYVSIFEEYFTYWSPAQKEQTLDFLYELEILPDGDIARPR
ncbi:MAG: hypothetical protein V8R40_06250 [Dysosmobacter sp.]